MAGPDKKVSIVLTGGADNRSFDELISPIITQGQAPKLKQSINTRLSKRPGTCVRSPKFTQVVEDTAGNDVYALVPSAAGTNTIRYRDQIGAGGHKLLSGDGSGSDGSGYMSTGEWQYLPARVERGGALAPTKANSSIAVGYNATTGRVWSVSAYSYGATQDGVTIMVLGTDGAVLGYMPVFFVITPLSAIAWFGVTCHGATGDRLWYSGPNGICYRDLTLTTTSIVLGSEVVVVVPGSATHGMCVVAGAGNYAYLAHSQNGSATGGTLRRVDVTTGTTTHSVNFAGALNGGGKCAVYYSTVASNDRVGVAFSSVTGANTTVGLYDATLSVVLAPFTIAQYGHVAVKFDVFGASTNIVVAVSTTDGDPSAAPGTYIAAAFLGTKIYTYSFAGALVYRSDHGWMTLQNHGVGWKRNGREVPIFALGRSYSNVSWEPGAENYADDACHVLYAVQQIGRPIAKYGTVRSNSLNAFTVAHQALSSSGAVLIGDKVLAVYKKNVETVTTPVESAGRYVVVDLAPKQPSIAHDRDGAALCSGANPMLFDGVSTSEISGPSLFAPKVYDSGPTVGGAMAAGVYRYAVVYRMPRSDGTTARSRPSEVKTVTLGGGNLSFSVYVTNPAGMEEFRNGIGTYVTATLYLSEANGTSLHFHSEIRVGGGVAMRAWTLNTVLAADFGAGPQIYTTASAGEELPPQPPPPLRDVAIVTNRCWGIDAEFPTRLVHSKLRIAGVGYEFHPALDVLLPSGAGDGMAVREWQGLTVVLCENGVYQVSGDGPNNNGSAGSFSPPVKVSDIGCTNTSSVALFPGGIIWQENQRFVMLSGAGVDYMPDFDCLYDVAHAIVLRRHNEVLFFSDTVAEIRVYNYAVKKWTTWDSQTFPYPVQAAALLPWDDDKAFVYAKTPGRVYRLDADSVSDATNMTWDTDWFLLGGDFQDHVLVRDIVLNGAIVGPHSVTIELYMDYEATPSRTQTWSSSQLDAIDVAGRYTVRLEPKETNCRAMRIKVYDTITGTSDGMAPRSLTVVWAMENILFETAFVEGSRA